MSCSARLPIYIMITGTFFSLRYRSLAMISLYAVGIIVAVIVSIYTGIDSLSWQKVVAAVLVFAGVAIVNRSRAAGQPKPEKAAV